MITLKELIIMQLEKIEKVLTEEGERGKLLGKAYDLYQDGRLKLSEYECLFDMIVSDDSENGFIAQRIINDYYKKRSLLKRWYYILFKAPQGLLHLDLDDHYTCYFCKLEHKNVEAGGMWACPNLACSGPGGHYHRRDLKSYKETNDGHHTIQILEYLDWIVENGKKITDPAIKLAIGKSVRKWLS